MKAFVVDKYKKKGALRLANVPEPEFPMHVQETIWYYYYAAVGHASLRSNRALKFSHVVNGGRNCL